MITEELNPLGLKFVDPTRVEEIILQEIIDTYKPDGWGLNPGNVLLEVGGHSGTLSMHCAKKYGCEVYVYESSPLNFSLLTQNIHLNGLENLIHASPLAITKDGRKIRVRQNMRNSGASNIYGNKKRKDPLVDSLALKNVIKYLREKGKKIQVLLLDCEGAEYELLENPSILKGIPLLRGEFHQQYGDGDIDGLLKKVKVYIPNSDPWMQRLEIDRTWVGHE